MPNRTKDDLWERQPGESAQAYEAFAIYRDMGSNRSLRVVAEQLSKSDTLIKRWSREKKWGERCRAYDNHLDDVARQEALRKYKKMRTRHIGIALQLQEKALAELKNLPDGSMTPKDIIQFLDKATELERDNPLIWQGVLGSAIVTGAELVTGMILNVWLGLGVWDYSGMPFNYKGQICLPFSILWIFVSIAAVVIDDWLRYWLFGEEHPHYTLFRRGESR